MKSTGEDSVAQRVRDRMAAQGLSQQGLAELLGKRQQWLGRRLVGETKFEVTEVIAIAAALQVDVTELLPKVDAA